MAVLLRVLVYTDGGLGASEACVKMTIRDLRRALTRLSPKEKERERKCQFVVEKTDAAAILGGALEQSSCRLLVMPGGRDLPYCSRLNGQGNENIRRFVREGGSYLGICAGAYYGSRRVEFALGDQNLEVVGPRELDFYPGVARGPVFAGFNYDSNVGAQACMLSLNHFTSPLTAVNELSNVSSLFVYYNGGCCFAADSRGVGNHTGQDSAHKVEVLATYNALHEPNPQQNIVQLDAQLPDSSAPFSNAPAAIVSLRHGAGRVILTGVHIESGPAGLTEAYSGDPHVESLVERLRPSENARQLLFDTLISHLLQ